ncbi:MAG: FHA domain-containing protein [Gammaproteobacteria bacterium]|nr:FHA domain-containing protein [Gammaproteobacteria bacterium]
MYLNRFNLKAAPFGPEADPDFFFLSDRHAEARRHIDQVLWHDETFVVILGEEGIGKTMLLQHLLDDVAGEVPLIHLSAPTSEPVDLLRNLLAVLGFDDIEAEREEYRNILAAYLMHQQRQGSRPVVVLDNIETFSLDVLAELRWLADIGDADRSALHFLLFGKEEFAEQLLAEPVREFSDQLRVRYEMRGFSEGETLAYINHRLDLVGGENRELIPESVVPLVYRYTSGVPGKINQLCAASLEIAAAHSRLQTTAGDVETAIETLGLEPRVPPEVAREDSSLSAFRRDENGKFVITLAGKLCGTVTLEQERVVIGRHTLNNICIDSNAVSRCHAQVIVVEGVPVLMDLNSTNGTFVNFKRIQQHVLRDNDIVAIGRHRLKFVAGAAQREHDATPVSVPGASQTLVLDSGDFTTARPSIKRVK